jgi:hypothetical protein
MFVSFVFGFRLNHSSIGAKNLTINPGAIRASEESDGGGDVLRRAQALERIHFRKAIDQLVRFTL